MLPEMFIERMKILLKDEYPLFLESYKNKNIRALRYNPNYVNEDTFSKLFKYDIQKINYDQEGFYLNEEIKVGELLYHQIGLFYMQDPSAMIPVNTLDIQNNWHILDLCAAPGGKTFQLATRTSGIVVANEINIKRNKILQSNIERLGLRNVILTNLEATEIGNYYPNTFDLILVDAPCSGEGMFRKYPESIEEWSLNEVKKCSLRQLELLNNIKDCVKQNGYIIYSTCTFSKEENEIVITEFLKNKDFELIPVKKKIEDITKPGIDLKLSRRFYPHEGLGEGQFVALLKRKSPNLNINNNKYNLKLNQYEEKIVNSFLDNVNIKLPIYKYNNNIVTLNLDSFPLKTKNILSLGVKVGEIKNNRFIPHHQFFKAYGVYFNNQLNLDFNDERLKPYLQGLEIQDNTIKNGYGVIIVNNIPVGYFKASNGNLKNHYPKGLRTII